MTINRETARLRKALLSAAGGALALSLGLALPALEVRAQAQRAAAAPTTAPITKGQKIVMATHSFNVFISPVRGRDPAVAPSPGPLAALAAERGKAGHETLAVQMIGASTPMQHWNQGAGDDTKNIAKVALTSGGRDVDVFTMSPNARMPEEGIDLFGDFIIKNNPNARIMVQSSWSAYDGKGSTPSVGGTGGGSFTNAERDSITVEELDRWLASQDSRPDAYLPRLRAQLEGIDKRAGRQITYVVPSSTAVYNLRKEVIAGRVPGFTKQSQLFRDPIGHATTPTSNLVTYVWFAAMYRESPVGLQALVDKNDPNSAARERILQQIAWNAVVDEPKSGVRGAKVAVGEGVVTASR